MTTTIHTAVAEKVSACAPAVKARIVDALVEKEVASRAEVISNGLDKFNSLEKEQKGFKPDNVVYDNAGTVIQEGWSKGALERRAKLDKQVTELRAAIELALGEGNMEPLRKALKGGGNNDNAKGNSVADDAEA